MFIESRLMILNKVDLLPHVDFDVDRARREAREMNPSIDILEVSCKTGEGIDAWIDWIGNFYRKRGGR
jgi:hydrogenase nickel incorporation protein HypB